MVTSAPSPLATPLPWNLVAEGYATELVPFFEKYASDALRLTGLVRGAKVLDVAAGPGTLSVLAARRGADVLAIDFSSAMVDQLRCRVASRGVQRVEVRIADGQCLPLPAARFDRAYSMFGLIFFPERARGFSELLRVLRPGGRAAVSSWHPLDAVPHMAVLLELAAAELPGLPFAKGQAPLGTADQFRREMASAGFRSVAVHTVAHDATYPSMEAFLRSMWRSSAPFTLLRARMGEEAWVPFAETVAARMAERFGDGMQCVRWPAHIAVGSR